MGMEFILRELWYGSGRCGFNRIWWGRSEMCNRGSFFVYIDRLYSMVSNVLSGRYVDGECGDNGS